LILCLFFNTGQEGNDDRARKYVEKHIAYISSSIKMLYALFRIVARNGTLKKSYKNVGFGHCGNFGRRRMVINCISDIK
jgi:hypothetical protein